MTCGEDRRGFEKDKVESDWLGLARRRCERSQLFSKVSAIV